MRATPLVLTVLISFPFPTPVRSQDLPPPSALKLPAEVRGSPQSEIVVKADTSAKKVGWRSLTPGLMIVTRSRLLDQREMVCFACVPGRYRLAAWCASPDGDVTEQVETTVVVDGVAPHPDPVVPDAFVASLQTAYDADADPKKAEQLKDLKAIWKLAPALCDPRNDGKDPATVGALIEVVRAAASAMTRDALKGVRVRLAEELKVALPDPTAALDDPTRARAKAAFTRLASSLDRVK